MSEETLTLELPPKLTEDFADILRRPNFACGGLAELLRFDGWTIATRAEAEQAAVLYFMLRLLAEYGTGWRERASAWVLATDEKRKAVTA